MARIDPIQTEQASDRSRKLMDSVEQKLGMVPNIMKTMAHSHATLGAYLGFSGALAGGELSARQREQIALAVAEASGCGYCLAAHSSLGKLAGLSELEVRDARTGHATGSRDDAILHFARDVWEKRGQVSDDAVGRARQAGLTDAELTEVIANVALNVFTNSLNLVAGTEVDFPAVAPLEADAHATATH